MKVSESVFSVPAVIKPKDMENPEVDHIGVMAYAAWHRNADAFPVPVQTEDTCSGSTTSSCS